MPRPQLWLQEARYRLDEVGAGFHYSFAPNAADAIRELLKTGRLNLRNGDTPSCQFDEVGGHVMGLFDLALDDTDQAGDGSISYGWTPSPSAEWVPDAGQPEPWQHPTGAGWTSAMVYTGDDDWALNQNAPPTTTEDHPANRGGIGYHVRLITYAQTAAPVIIQFGGRWRVKLYDDGEGELWEYVTTAEGSTYQARAVFPWMVREEFRESEHWVVIYCVRQKLVIRNMALDANGKQIGLCWHDEGAQEDDTLIEPDGTPARHAIGKGLWGASGTGRITIGMSRVKFATTPVYSIVGRPLFTAVSSGTTQPVTVALDGVSSNGAIEPTVGTYYSDSDVDTWPQAAGEDDPPTRTALRWKLTWSNTERHTYYLAALHIKIAPGYVSDAQVGTDVLAPAVAPAVTADRQVQVLREGTQDRERLTAELFAGFTNLASYVQPNMNIRYVADAQPWFRGRTDGATWRNLADADPPHGLLGLEAQGLWKRFRKALWPGGVPFDGRKLTDCMTEVVEAAGLAAAEYSILDDPYVIPPAPRGEAPSYVYRPGTTCDRIIEELRERFFGTRLWCYFRITDGKFYVEELSVGASQATFYNRQADAVAAGVPRQVILAGSYQEEEDESEFANYVTAIGQKIDGQPLIARAIDWGSIQDPTAVNYVGDSPYHLIVADPGLQTQAAVNYVCRSLFDRHRYPRVYVRWQSFRVNLYPPQVVTLSWFSGATTKLVRLDGVAMTQGDDTGPHGQMSFSGEVVG